MAKSKDIKHIADLYGEMLSIGETSIEQYLAVHRRFHFAIYDVAQMPILSSVVEGLWLRIGPLLRASTRSRTQEDNIHHGAMLKALRAGDTAELQVALRNDLTDGIEAVITYLDGGSN